jgi:hypothetical protein
MENSKAIYIKPEDIPLNEAGEPDIAAILAANGLSHIDLSQMKIVKANDAE